MITRCFAGPDLLGLEAGGFFFDVSALMTVAVPAAICYALWRLFVTNRTGPRGGVVVLGLDNSSAADSELYGRRISRWNLLLYAVTSFLTFNFGVFVFEGYRYLQELLCSGEWRILS